MSIIENIIDIPMEHERNVCGEFDVYLKKIERTLKVSMIARDGSIKVIGPKAYVDKAKSVFNWAKSVVENNVNRHPNTM